MSSLGASYCTRIFVSRASAFARLRKVPACGQKRLLRAHGNLPRPLDRHDCAHRAFARRIILHANLRLPRVGFRPAARRRQCARICRRKEARRRKRLLRPTPRFHGNLPRPLDRHGCAHRAFARRITRIFVSRASAFARLCAAANAPESAVGRKRRRKRLLRPAPRFHGNFPRPIDRHGRAHRVLARRVVLHANLRLPRVGLRPAARRRQRARIRRRKEARHASVRAKTTSTTRPAPSR